MDQKLRKREHLHRPEEYRRVYRTGKEVVEKGIGLRISPNNLGFSRLGMAIPKRIIPRAVARNRIKRYLREVYRQNKGWIAGSYDIIFVFRGKDAQALNFRQIERLALLLLRKQGIINK